MTAVDHAELKRLAEAATPGPWNNSGRSVDDFDAECMMRMEWIANGAADDDDDLNANVENDAAFIAAANPAVVLALLSEIEGLKAALAEANDDAIRWSRCAGEMAVTTEGWKERAVAAEDALRIQAPDSWRPDREAVDALLRIGTVFQALDDDAPDETPVTLRAVDVATLLEALADTVRPQTAESA